MRFGRAIVAARKKAEMSQAELARKLGVSTGTIAGWELDDTAGNPHGHGFRLDRLPKIAKALGVTVDELVKAAA